MKSSREKQGKATTVVGRMGGIKACLETPDARYEYQVGRSEKRRVEMEYEVGKYEIN